MLVHIIQHEEHETAGSIITWAEKCNHNIKYINCFDNPVFPEINEVEFLIILGGSMNVHDFDIFEWMQLEKNFVTNCIAAQKKVLGICLGAQLIIDALGGEVIALPEVEFGWHKVYFENSNPLFPQQFSGTPFFHWHYFNFALLPDFEKLAWSDACKNQAYMYNKNVLGIQFHPEMDETKIKNITPEEVAGMGSGQYIQSFEQINNIQAIKNSNDFLFNLLDNFLKF